MSNIYNISLTLPSSIMQDVTTNLNKQEGNYIFSDWMWKLLILWSKFECPRKKKGTVMNSLFLVSEQFIYLGFIHILHIFEVQSQLLCLFSFFTIHLQDGVMPLLQILKMHIHTIISKKETAPLALAAPVYPFPHTEFTLSRILNLGISFTFSSISSFWFVSRTSSSVITARDLSRLEISTCKVFI